MITRIVAGAIFILLLILSSCTPQGGKNGGPQIVEETKGIPEMVDSQVLFQTSLVDSIPLTDEVITGNLDNGLNYFIRPNTKPENKVELRLVVNAGSIQEDQSQLGLAHFTEHMLFNGTKNFKKNTLVDYLQKKGVQFGAHLNAYTSFDETVYMLSLPSDSIGLLDTGFQILEDWASGALLDGEEIDNERGVVLEEYRIGLGANKRMMQEYLPVIFHESRYAKRLPIGELEVLENFDHEELRSFYRDWYRPDLMSVIVVGDIDPVYAEEKIKGHFESLENPQDPRPRKNFDIPNHRSNLASVVTDPEAPYGILRLIFKNPWGRQRMSNKRDYKSFLERQLFTSMINNRLLELQNSPEPPFVYSAVYYGDTWARPKDGFQAFAVVGENGHMLALETIAAELERVRQHGFVKSEFERAGEALLLNYEKAFKEADKTESDGLASELVQHVLVIDPVPGITWEYEFVREASKYFDIERMNTMASEILRKDNRVFVLTGPEKEGIIMPSEDEVLQKVDEIESQVFEAYEESEVPEQLLDPISQTGEVIERSFDSLLEVHSFTLSNGAKVKYKTTDFKNDQIVFRAQSKGGSNLIGDEDYAATYLTYGAIPNGGLNGYDETTVAKYLQGKQVNLRPYLRANSEGMRGSSTVKDLESLFELIHLNFSAMTLDSGAYESYVNKEKAIYKNLASDPVNYFFSEQRKYLRQNDDRYKGWPVEEDWVSMDYKKGFDLYRQRFSNAADFDFYFVGNVDAESLEALCAKYIGTLPTSDTKEEFASRNSFTPTTMEDLIIRKGTEQKSYASINYNHEVEYNHEDRIRLGALADILQIKLIEILREEKGGVYGLGVSGGMSKEPTSSYYFTVRFPCGPENIDDLVNTTEEEIKRLCDEGPLQKDIDKVKEANRETMEVNLKKNEFWLEGLSKMDFEKVEGSHYFGDVGQQSKYLTIDQLQSTACEYLKRPSVVSKLLPEN